MSHNSIDMTTHGYSREHRFQQLEKARALATECSYDAALEVVEKLLFDSPNDIEILRLKGNILEQKTLDLYEYSQQKLTRSSEFLLARECYEQILRLDPQNSVALIDLGDHYKYLDAYDKAFSYYDQAVAVLRSCKNSLSRFEEIEELLGTCLDLGRQKQTEERAQRLKVACEELLQI